MGFAVHTNEQKTSEKTPIKGRGTSENIPNRFEKIELFRDPDGSDWVEDILPSTVFLKDKSRSILAYNDSPDIPFSASVNPYRGCEHGCIYCYARPTHEYLGFSPGLDFESKIMVKENAPALLRRELSSKRWKPQTVALSGVTDCYQPAERELRITRQLLEVLLEFRNPAIIITKSALVLRDMDILKEMARFESICVYLSITSLDADLCGLLEPRAARPAKRIETLRRLNEAGIPAGVMVAPVILGLTDHEMIPILKAAREAGAVYAGFVPIRLPHGVAPLFEKWLTDHRPLAKTKILQRISSIREGRLNDPQFGSRMKGTGEYAEHLAKMFSITRKRLGFSLAGPPLSTRFFQSAPQGQLSLDV